MPPEEVEIWLTHLQTIQTNRKRGAAKAAVTRSHQQKTVDTDEVEHWIGCDKCTNWSHCECVGIDHANLPDCFFCPQCKPPTTQDA